jgi:hypothetical protein
MTRTTIAIAFATLLFAAAPAVSHASPIAPLPSGVANEAASGDIDKVWCRGCGRRGWGWRGHGWRGYGWRGYGWRWGWGPGYGWRWCRWNPYRCAW